MKNFAFLLAPLVALAACQPLPNAAPDDTIAPDTLLGEYRVAGIDGEEVDLPYAITLSIRSKEIRYTSQCIQGRWSYTHTGNRLATTPLAFAVCQREALPEELAISATFSAGPMITRTPANGITFTGGGHTVTVFSQ